LEAEVTDSWKATPARRAIAPALLLTLAMVAQAWRASRVEADTPSPSEAPAVGDVIPEFDAASIQGSREHIGFPKGETTVLLFFLSGCPTCHKMLPQWNRAFERRRKGLTVIGVLMDQEPPGFFQTVPIAFPVVRSPGREFLNGLKVRRAPLTLRVGAGGKVEDVSLGVVDPIRLGQLFR
jgi:Redoxin